MAALARKLCEAVENEDAKEVENLLNCGADPNLVLPDGIAAIHLASGKESESALRCLTMILQKGGDPNVRDLLITEINLGHLQKLIFQVNPTKGKTTKEVCSTIFKHYRSIEELTPIHVAACWGCCKALIFLLRKGGDPNIPDQDGNTALDLALMERNRRCVVVLQEYNERNEDICPDKIHGCYNINSCEPVDIPEMSSITLLLESTHEVSPCSSTRMSPFISAPKNGTRGKYANDAALASQVELPRFDTKIISGKYEHHFTGLESSKLQLNEKTADGNSDLKADNSKSECAVLTTHNWHCKEKYVSSFSSDIIAEKYSAEIESNKVRTSVRQNFWEDNNSDNQAKEMVISSISSQPDWENKRPGKEYSTSLLNYSNQLTESQFILKEWEGIDVTSPDHVYTYSRSHSDNDLDKTLVLRKTNTTEGEGTLGQESSSSSKYTSCSSNGFITLIDNSITIETAGIVSDIRKTLLDPNHSQIDSQNYGVVEIRTNPHLCCMLNVQDSVPTTDNASQKRKEYLNNVEITSSSASMLNCKYLALSSQNMVSDGHENKAARNTELLCNSQSPTLSAGDTNVHKSCSHDFKTLKQGNCSLSDCSVPIGELSCSSTVPVIRETNPPIKQNLKDISYSDTSVDTLMIESTHTENRDKLDAELCDLKKMMLATKVIHPVSSILSEEKSPCFFTERTRSRLQSSKFRHRSSSLFDESVEMPQRGRRLRSPNGKSESPVPSVEIRKSFSHCGLCQSEPTSDACEVQDSILVQITKVPEEKVSEPETTVSMTNFLTDDLSSSETEVKSTTLLKKIARDSYLNSRISESVWLTEDGDTESNEDADQKHTVFGSNKSEEDLPAVSPNGSFLHSTLNVDAVLNPSKAPRYSFSRLSCVSNADEARIKLTTIPDPVMEELHLSPGGRPVNVSHFEPVDYLYMDNEKGHALVERRIPCADKSSSNISDTSDDTIVYDWRNYSKCKEKINKGLPVCTPSRVAVELYRLSNNEIARRLRELGEDPGQINSKTRKVCILLLDKRLKEQATSGPVGMFLEYSPELSLALHTCDIPDCKSDDAVVSREFDQPDKTRKWREGVLKSSFNYLLLDPRVTRNLPSRCHILSQPECFRTFVRAVFYVGKGKRARPYCHLYESLTHYKGSNKQPCSKVQHIVDIWKSGQGVLSLHCFQNTIPVEAYTREACMVDAIGLKMLTNQKKGVYYGQAENWTLARRRRLGVHMLHRAMQIFLAEGERQLRPPDIRTGR